MKRPDTIQKNDPMRVLFVCTGNTCRSPLAEVLAKEAAELRGLDGVEFRSAGVHTDPGLSASIGAQDVAKTHGLSLEHHASSVLTQELVEWAQWVFSMGPGHLQVVELMGGEGKSGLLGVFAETGKLGLRGVDPDEGGIQDPFGGNAAVYEETFQALKNLVGLALDRMVEGVEE